MGIYQLRYLERIPAHAAVAESVELVKRARKTSAAGLRQCGAAQGESRPGRVARRARSSSPARSGCSPAGSGNYGAGRRGRDRASRAARAGEVHRAAGACRTSARSPSCRCSACSPGSVSRSLRGAREQDRAGAGIGRAGRRLRHPPPPHRAAEGRSAPTCWSWTAPSRCPSPAGSTASWWTRPAPAPARWAAIRRSSGGCARTIWPICQRRQEALLRERAARCWRPAASWSIPPARWNPRRTKRVAGVRGRLYMRASRARRGGWLLRRCDKIG